MKANFSTVIFCDEFKVRGRFLHRNQSIWHWRKQRESEVIFWASNIIGSFQDEDVYLYMIAEKCNELEVFG